jgi:hypothetical protein
VRLPSARLARSAVALLRNQLRAPSFSRRVGRDRAVPEHGVALFFGTGPENAYQFEQWRRPLERLAESTPVFVIVDRPDTGELVLRTSTLPVAFARGSAALETLVADRDVRVVLYCNQVEPNFRMLRFAAPVHVQIGHGESDKASSTSNQHKAYDLVFVGGDAGRDRLGAALRGFDAATRTVPIGRPQLDHDYAGAPDWTPGSGRRVLYAPTWEGDRPSIAYGSLVSHGVPMIRDLMSDPRNRIIYRPHPRTRQTTPAYAAADREVRALLEAAGDRHLVDEGGYGWQWAFADACVTDVSAVAYDWLATGKPLVITRPADPRAELPPSELLETLRLLPAEQAGEVGSVLATLESSVTRSAEAASLRRLAEHYFGDTADGASSDRFEAAVKAAAALSAG